MFALGQFLHQQHVSASLGESDYGALAVFAHDGVHLPVAEARPVSLWRTLVYAYTLGYVPHLGCAVGPAMPVVFHLVTAVRSEFAARIGADKAVYELVGYSPAVFLHVRLNLLGRPVLGPEQVQRLPHDCGVLCTVGRSALPAFHGLLVSLVPQIVASLRGIASDLAAEC